MKFKRTKTTRKITKLLAMTMLSEQIMMVAPVINAHAAEETPAEYSIEYNVTSSWGGGCVAELTLNNLADADTENWTVSFCTKDEITNLWGGRITDRKELLVSDASVEVYATVETDVEEEAEERIANEDMTEEEPTSEKAAMEEKSVEEAVEADTEKEITEGGKDTSDSVETTERKAEDVSETELLEEELTDLLEEEYKEVLEEDLFEEEFPDEETEEETEEEKHTYFRYTVEALDYNAVIPAGGSVTIGYNAIGDDHAIWDEKAEIILKETAEEEDTIPTGGIYEGDSYTVEVVIPAHWDGTYNVQLRITNTSEETLHNWAFVMETEDSVSGLYNAVELSDNNGVHLIKNAGYNQDVPAGGTVEVGYTASYEEKPDIPVEFALSQMEKEVTTAECEVSLFITEEWEDGGLAEIVLTNISGLPIEDWMLEFDSTLDIEEIWGGVIESHEGEHYFLRNSGYAQNILPGESWIIGMIFSGNATDMGNINLKQIVANDKKELAEKEIIDDISIIELDTSMAENSVGRIWFKELISDDEIICSSDGLLCVRDQILLTTIGKNYEEVEDFVKKYDARIVGCIELTGDYQIEFNHTLEVEELESFVNTFKCESFIRSSELNYIWLESPDFNTTDPWKEGAEEDWLIGGVADGSNWALEAIDYVDALVEAEIIDDSGTVKLEDLTTTSIGIIDDAFDEWHDDLKSEIAQSWMNYEDEKRLQSTGLSHGTQTTGIIGATINNKNGISGVSLKHDLYLFALSTGELWKTLDTRNTSKLYSHTFRVKCALGTLIAVSNVKVINYSWGNKDLAFAMSRGDTSADTYIHEAYIKSRLYFSKQTNCIAEYLDNLLDKGYDFLIVTTAGNANNKKFIETGSDDPMSGGYALADDSFTKETTYGSEFSDADVIVCKEIDAKYNSVFNNIPTTWNCYKNIICVGAIKNPNQPDYTDYYEISDFSNRGSRVDVLAPGEKVFTLNITGMTDKDSVATDCTEVTGTSFSAPYVTGAVGLAYSINAEISAMDMKRAIIDSARDEKLGAPILDMASLVRGIKPKDGNVILRVTDDQGKGVPNADVRICQTSSFGRYGIWVMLYDGVDPHSFQYYALTDENGVLACNLEPVNENSSGCYTIFVDKENRNGATTSIGAYYGEKFHDGLTDGERRTIEIELSPYDDAENTTVGFCVFDGVDKTLNQILYEYDIRFYKGWGLSEYNNPVVEKRSPAKAWFNEVFSLSIPKGRYTVEFEKEGYAKKYMEILVTGEIGKPFLVVMGKKDNSE